MSVEILSYTQLHIKYFNTAKLNGNNSTNVIQML